MEPIYERPGDYDLEHEGDHEDVRFYLDLVSSLRPRRVLELAAGSGRVTIPLAQLAARNGFNIVGLERSEAMLDAAEQKLGALSAFERRCVAFVQGDLREWPTSEPFDLILVPCSSLSHLLTLEDQVAAWTRAHDNLAVGGRFVVDLTMPNLGVYVDSMQTPPRTLLEIDIDTRDPVTGGGSSGTRPLNTSRTSSGLRSASFTTSFPTARRSIGMSATSTITSTTRARSSCSFS